MDIGTLIFAGGGLIFLVFVALFIRKQTQRRLPAPGVDPEKVLADHAGKDSADLDPFRDEADVPVPPAEAAPKQSLSAGLAKTKTGFMAKLNAVIFGRGLDEGLVDELEALLVTSDIGIRTAEKLLEGLKQDLSKHHGHRRQRRRQDHHHRQAGRALPRRGQEGRARRRRHLPRRRRGAAGDLGPSGRAPR
jgi:signal recognition particle GTPase